MSARELYDRVRGSWRVGLTRVRNAKPAFGVLDDRTVEVYCIDGWFSAGQGEASESEDGRYQFVWHFAGDELRERYKGQLVANLAQGQNPIRYVGDTLSSTRSPWRTSALRMSLAAPPELRSRLGLSTPDWTI